MTRSDLEARGWVECGTCGETGEVHKSRVYATTGRSTDNHMVPCPDCVLGLVPSEKAVEATAQQLFNAFYDHDNGEDYQDFDDGHIADTARMALIAAARAEME